MVHNSFPLFWNHVNQWTISTWCITSKCPYCRVSLFHFDICSIYERSFHSRHSCGLSNWHLGVEHPVVLDRQLSYHGSCLAIFLLKFSLFLTNQIFSTLKHYQKTSDLINIFTAFITTLLLQLRYFICTCHWNFFHCSKYLT